MNESGLQSKKNNSLPVIEVKDLRVHFNLKDQVVKAVDGVSFDIKKGETIAIVGESGSGKSVTALSLMRLVDFSGGNIISGEINLETKNKINLDLAQQSQDIMKDIRGNDVSMIFQEPMTSLNPVFTIRMQMTETILKHQGKTRAEALEIALEMLKLVRIPEPEKRLNQYPHELSGGMRQRVMIAMALSCKPSLLIADEPTTALDVTIQAQILDLIKLLQRDIGMSVIFITHDMGVVAEIADRVVVMFAGKKVEEGSALEIFNNPQHPYTKSLLAAVPKLGSMKGKLLPAKFMNVDINSSDNQQLKTTTQNKIIEIKDTVNRVSNPLLQVRGLTTRFSIKQDFGTKKGNIHAVENIDLERSTLGIAVPVLIQLVMQFAPNVGLLGEARLAMNDVETAVEFEETLEDSQWRKAELIPFGADCECRRVPRQENRKQLINYSSSLATISSSFGFWPIGSFGSFGW